MVYAPWCGHCKSMKPAYEQLAKALSVNPNIVIAKIDGTKNELKELQYEGFPTLYWLKKGSDKQPTMYDEGRSLKDLMSFI